MKIYAFDVDDTMEMSGGPVTISMVENEYRAGNLIGLLGNWMLAIQSWSDWWIAISFLYFQGDSPSGEKDYWMWVIKRAVIAQEYVMVGNGPGLGYNDKAASERGGFRFISENDFARGER